MPSQDKSNHARFGWIAHWVILAAVNVFLFFPILKGYFYYDDFQMLGDVKNIPDWSSALWAQYQQGYALRPVLDLILWARFTLFGWSAVPYFAISIIQNIIVTFLVYILAKQLLHKDGTAFMAGLVFAVAFPPIQVVTWITGSNISLLAIFYLATIICFIQFLKSRRPGWYAGTLVAFALAVYTAEYAITLLPAMILAALFLRANYPIRLPTLAAYLLPFGLVLTPYLWVQSQFIRAGTSEGAANQGIGLGLHIFPAFLNLSHLVIPDLHYPRLTTFLTEHFPVGLPVLMALNPIFAALWVAATVIILIRGNRVSRFLVLWIYLVFAPFTLWINPDSAHASRYLYLPMIAFAMLLAMFFDWAAGWMEKRKTGLGRFALFALIGFWLAYNAGPIVIFEVQEVEKGQLRRIVIESIQKLHPEFPAGSQIYIGVPHQNYRDLQWAIPEFYNTPITVTTIPPAEWPLECDANCFRFTINEFQLIEQPGP